MDAATAGFWASIPAAVAITASLTVPRLATPSRRLWILLGLFLAGCVATVMLHSVEGPVLAAGLILQGVARGGMMTVAILTLIEIPEVGSRRTGLAGGLFFSAAEVGGVLGPVSMGVLAEMTGNFTAALQMMTGVCVGLVVLLGVLRRVAR